MIIKQSVRLVSALLLALLLANGCQAFDGAVYTVSEGKRQPVTGCLLSDGNSFVTSGQNGEYAFSGSERFVFVIPPDGYICKDWYADCRSVKQADFELTPATANNLFAAAADAHYSANADELSQALSDREMTVDHEPVLAQFRQAMQTVKPSFVIVLGDMAASAKDLSPQAARKCLEDIKAKLNSENIQTYYLPGNHEISAALPEPAGLFEDVFGPAYYSFNNSAVHYVALNAHSVRNNKSRYEIDDRQLQWLKQDLSRVPSTMPIVVFSHEPLCDLAKTAGNSQLLQVLCDNNATVHISGHWHQASLLAERPLMQLTCGSLCGGWWAGDAPSGDFAGYSLFNIARGKMDYGYFPADGINAVWFEMPQQAVLSGIEQIRIVSREALEKPELYVDDRKYPYLPQVQQRKGWTDYYYNLNVTALARGAHQLKLLQDGKLMGSKRFWVDNPRLLPGELFDNPDCFNGRTVSLSNLTLDVKWGDYAGFSELQQTLMANIGGMKFPFKLDAGQKYDVSGFYRGQYKVIDPLNIWQDEGVVRQ